MAGTVTQKQALLQFLDKHGLRSGLKIEVAMGPPPPAPPHFKCTALVPVFEASRGTFVPKPFYGEGSTKKASEHAASNNALAFINLQGLLPENLKASLAVDQVDKQQMENTKIAIEALRRDPANTDQASEQNPGATQKQEEPPPAQSPVYEIPSIQPIVPNNNGAQEAQRPPILDSLLEEENKPPNKNVTMWAPPNGTDKEIESYIGNQRIVDLTPVQLKEELQKALDRNTQLKSAIHHEKQRRERALTLLLGLE